MYDIVIMGEIIAEIMREREDVPLDEAGTFIGPFPSGAPAICIDAAARLGCKTAIIGGVGKDDFGKLILNRLNKDGVDTSRVIESENCSTGCAFVTYFGDGSRKFLFHMGNTPAVDSNAPDEGSIESKFFHIMGCSLMANEEFAGEILKTMRLLKNSGARISFDPNIRKELMSGRFVNDAISEVMENISVFMPGVEELLTVTKTDNIEDGIKKCFEYENMEIVCMKNGSKGSRIYTRDDMIEVGVYKVEQKDATGAGDCFDGAFLAGICQNKSIEEAAKMGAAAGALNAAAFGPMEGRISPENVQAMINGKEIAL